MEFLEKFWQFGKRKFWQFGKENFDSFEKENFDSLERKILTVWKKKILTVWKGKFWQFEKGNFDSLEKENFDSLERKILTVWKRKFWQFEKENFDRIRETPPKNQPSLIFTPKTINYAMHLCNKFQNGTHVVIKRMRKKFQILNNSKKKNSISWQGHILKLKLKSTLFYFRNSIFFCWGKMELFCLYRYGKMEIFLWRLKNGKNWNNAVTTSPVMNHHFSTLIT
jgi:hypothetical protein